MRKNLSTPITLVLLGDIAAGKGTQAKILAKKYRLKHIDTGDFSRKLLSGKIKVKRDVSRVARGGLTPSDLIQNFLRRELESLPKSKGVLVDGGKMPGEARLISQIFKKLDRKVLVIYLSIPKSEIFQRLKWRYYDAKTGKPLIIKGRVRDGKYRGRNVIKRADDEPEAIKNRINYYNKVYKKTVEFWRSEGVLGKISGKGSITQVTTRITQTIDKYFF